MNKVYRDFPHWGYNVTVKIKKLIHMKKVMKV